jgi:hypothetical protein
MIFNAEMVRALLDGSKTQTRRMLTPRQLEMIGYAAQAGECYPLESGQQHANSQAYYREWCPFGVVGDRIWVREAFRVMGCATDVARLMYKASERNSFTESTRTVPVASCTKQPSQKWTPSIHMPRWASRITLEITNVRVERLQAITLGDICKEIGCGLYDFRPATYGFQVWEELWESIYGAESWQANPWVWVIKFKRVE